MSTPQQPPWPARGLKPWDTALKAYIDFIAGLIGEGGDGGGGGGGGPLPPSLAGTTVADANLATESGFYTVFSFTPEDQQPIDTHMPPGMSFGSMFVAASDLGYPGLEGYIHITQVFVGTGAYGLEMHIRTQSGGALFGAPWGAWKPVPDLNPVNERITALEQRPTPPPVINAVDYYYPEQDGLQGSVIRDNSYVTLDVSVAEEPLESLSVGGLIPAGYRPTTALQRLVGVDLVTGDPRAFVIRYFEDPNGVLTAVDGGPLGKFAISALWFCNEPGPVPE